MSEIKFEELHPDFGARVTGLTLGGQMPPEEVEAVREAIDRYSFLCFPDQDLSDEQHLAFTHLLGEPEAEHVTFGKTGKVEFFGTVGNVKDDGTKEGSVDAGTRYQRGNELWHSDSSFREVPSFVSITHPYEVPGEGGATEFVSERAAYARLPEDKRAEIAELQVIHDYVFSRSPVAPVDPNHAASLPPVKHPLVKTNPGNGEKNLYIGSHTRSVVGWPGIDSRCLLNELLELTARPQDIYAHFWRAGDTVIWDNRCLLHRGTGFDADRWRRRMRQTRVVGSERGVV